MNLTDIRGERSQAQRKKDHIPRSPNEQTVVLELTAVVTPVGDWQRECTRRLLGAGSFLFLEMGTGYTCMLTS